MIISLLYSITVCCLFYGRVACPVLLGGALLLFFASLFLRKAHSHSHGGFLSIDVQAQRSRLSGWHPGLKTGFCLVCAFWCIGANSVLVSLFIAAGMMAFTVGLGGTSAHDYLLLLTVPATFILLGTAAVLVDVSAAPGELFSASVGGRYLVVSARSQQAALLLIARALGAVSCLYFLSLTTPMHRIIASLRRARVPALMVELMYLIYRYIFVLLETQHQMQTAAAARLGYRDGRTSLRTMAACSRNLLFLSFRRSADCFAAMEARCYDGEITFLEEEAAVRKQELAPMAAYLLILSAVWLAARRLGI